MNHRFLKLASIVALFSIIFVMVLFGAVLTLVLPASANCLPSTAAVINGAVKTGTGMAANAYFAQFGKQVVAQKKANAALIIAIGQKRGFSVHSIEVAVATALQESGLLNLTYGDLDSLGLFQQRPSVGIWGTASQILNPVHAINAFYDHLKTVSNRDSMSLIDAAIAVQGPNVALYRATWHWDQIAPEIVTGSDVTGVCSDGGSGPVKEPLLAGYTVSDTFDDPNYTGAIKPHDGIDLYYPGGSLGKPVFAVRGGTVITSGAGQGCLFDNDVIIRHSDGTETGYLHMNGADITVHVGDTVTAGEKLGTINQCGQATGPHLHFEVLPGTDHEAWLLTLHSVQKYGHTFVDPTGYLAHFGVRLLP